MNNIIFDLGGVLLDLDYNRTITAFQQLGYPQFQDMYSQATADELFRKLEKGKISVDEFYEVMIGARAGGITKDQIQSAWNAMLLNWREDSLIFLSEVAKKYSIYLLSNTNALHFEAIHKSLREQTGRTEISSLFRRAYWSHLIGMRKPDREIFDFVLADAGLQAAETLFIDDSEGNIKAAAALGFRTHWLQPKDKIEQLGLL